MDENSTGEGGDWLQVGQGRLVRENTEAAVDQVLEEALPGHDLTVGALVPVHHWEFDDAGRPTPHSDRISGLPLGTRINWTHPAKPDKRYSGALSPLGEVQIDDTTHLPGYPVDGVRPEVKIAPNEPSYAEFGPESAMLSGLRASYERILAQNAGLGLSYWFGGSSLETERGIRSDHDSAAGVDLSARPPSDVPDHPATSYWDALRHQERRVQAPLAPEVAGPLLWESRDPYRNTIPDPPDSPRTWQQAAWNRFGRPRIEIYEDNRPNHTGEPMPLTSPSLRAAAERVTAMDQAREAAYEAEEKRIEAETFAYQTEGLRNAKIREFFILLNGILALIALPVVFLVWLIAVKAL